MDKIKKCPWCDARLHMDAKVCEKCKKRVGKAGDGGIAKKPFNWQSYLACLLVWIMFALYMWWAFFKNG